MIITISFIIMSHFLRSDVYEGDFVKGLFHGYGVYTYASGDRYVEQYCSCMILIETVSAHVDFLDMKETGQTIRLMAKGHTLIIKALRTMGSGNKIRCMERVLMSMRRAIHMKDSSITESSMAMADTFASMVTSMKGNSVSERNMAMAN